MTMATTTTNAQNKTGKTSEDSSLTLDVLSTGTTLYSLNQANPGVATQTSLGATISIVNGKIVYDGTSASKIQALGDGESTVDTFTYTIKLANGALSTATVSVTVTGANDGPTFSSSAASTAVTEIA